MWIDIFSMFENSLTFAITYLEKKLSKSCRMHRYDDDTIF